MGDDRGSVEEGEATVAVLMASVSVRQAAQLLAPYSGSEVAILVLATIGAAHKEGFSFAEMIENFSRSVRDYEAMIRESGEEDPLDNAASELVEIAKVMS